MYHETYIFVIYIYIKYLLSNFRIDQSTLLPWIIVCHKYWIIHCVFCCAHFARMSTVYIEKSIAKNYVVHLIFAVWKAIRWNSLFCVVCVHVSVSSTSNICFANWRIYSPKCYFFVNKVESHLSTMDYTGL